MALHTYATLDLVQANRLADLTGLKHDLQSAIELANRLSNQFEIEKCDFVLLDALSIAVLIRYNRAFVTGVRERLDLDKISLLTEDQKITHERLRFWRDKHIAHSVNAFEESQPVARFCLERVKEEGVYGIECNYSRVTSLSLDECASIIELSNLFLQYLESEISKEKKKLLVLAKTIPLDDLLLPIRQKPMLISGKPIDKARKKIS